MDLLQIGLVFFIFILSVLLIVLGIQVFFILRDLQKAVDKIDRFIGSAESVASNLEKPIKAVSEVAQMIESGVKVVKSLKNTKPARRLFKIK